MTHEIKGITYLSWVIISDLLPVSLPTKEEKIQFGKSVFSL